MAKKTVYQDFDADALDHFGLDEAPVMGVSSSNFDFNKVLVSESEATYNKVIDIIENNTSTNFTNCKKAFVLPMSPMSLDRIKAACKEHKITVTNDYELADMIIVHDNFFKGLRNGEKISNSLMTFKLWNFETISSFNNPSFLSSFDKANEWIKNHGEIIYDQKMEEYTSSHKHNRGSDCYDVWCFTGLGINLAYKIDQGDVTAVAIDDLLMTSATVTPFTEELGKLLSSQIQSYNDEDSELAGKLLPTIDPTGVEHLFWEFVHQVDSRIYKFNRNKDVQYWLNKVDWGKYKYESAEELITRLHEENNLNSEKFRYLEPQVRKDIHISNRDLYVFKVSVKPEYRKYLKPIEND
jgi:hypothetical protein|tara:strand:- start:14747 stop:15805 length:1059 start_codon:yes stop_codon:yes gene_type:complete